MSGSLRLRYIGTLKWPDNKYFPDLSEQHYDRLKTCGSYGQVFGTFPQTYWHPELNPIEKFKVTILHLNRAWNHWVGICGLSSRCSRLAFNMHWISPSQSFVDSSIDPLMILPENLKQFQMETERGPAPRTTLTLWLRFSDGWIFIISTRTLLCSTANRKSSHWFHDLFLRVSLIYGGLFSGM